MAHDQSPTNPESLDSGETPDVSDAPTNTLTDATLTFVLFYHPVYGLVCLELTEEEYLLLLSTQNDSSLGLG